jgi:hypothetical protein
MVRPPSAGTTTTYEDDLPTTETPTAEPQEGVPTEAVPVEDGPDAGRHRAAPSPPSAHRRVASALALVVAGLLGTALLGWGTAHLVGLTDGPTTAVAYEAPAPSIQPPDPVEPTLRTLDLPGTSATAKVDASPLAPATTAAPHSAAPEPERAHSKPAAAPPPQTARVATVRPNASCSREGSTATGKSGEPMVCTASRGNGSLRWRHA